MLSLEETEDVTVDEDTKMYAEEFNKKKMLFISAKLSGDRQLIVSDEERCRSMPGGGLADNSGYADFVASLPKAQASLFAVHFNMDGQEKVIFITWCPEGVELKEALILNVTKYHFSKLVKPDLNVKAAELEDLDEQEIKEQLETGRPPTAINGVFQQEDFASHF